MSDDHPLLDLRTRIHLPTDTLNPDQVATYVRDLWELADGLPRVHDQQALEYAGTRPETAPAPSGTTNIMEDHSDADWHEFTMFDLAPLLQNRQITSAALVSHMLSRIARFDPKVRSFASVSLVSALNQACELDSTLTAGTWRGPLHGIPIGVKDSIPVRGMRWSANSRLYQHRWAVKDATAIKNLRSAGVVFLGKHNLNEFGWSIPSEEDLTPPPRNPWHPSEYSVGSSSGSAAAVSARLSFGAVCTDGGGSARLPAGQHGLFGLKPSHDSVSRAGYTDRTLSEISFLARSAMDVALLFAAATHEAEERNGPVDELASHLMRSAQAVSESPGPLRIGIAPELVRETATESSVASSYEDIINRLRDVGHKLATVSPEALLPLPLNQAVAANFVILCAEAYADHAMSLKNLSALYGDSARHYISQGAYLSAHDYLAAMAVRETVRKHFTKLFSDVDALFLPTSPVTSTAAARNPSTHRRGGNAIFTSPFNLAGLPALSFPASVSPEGIPIGMQLIGPENSELMLLQLGQSSHTPCAFPDLNYVGEAELGGGGM